MPIKPSIHKVVDTRKHAWDHSSSAILYRSVRRVNVTAERVLRITTARTCKQISMWPSHHISAYADCTPVILCSSNTCALQPGMPYSVRGMAVGFLWPRQKTLQYRYNSSAIVPVHQCIAPEQQQFGTKCSSIRRIWPLFYDIISINRKLHRGVVLRMDCRLLIAVYGMYLVSFNATSCNVRYSR